MTPITTPNHARELADHCEHAPPTDRALRSLSDQVEALTAERDDLCGKNANLEGAILSHRQEIGKLRAELDNLKKQSPIAYLAWRDGNPCWEGDDCVCSDAVYPVDSDDDRSSKPLYLAAGSQPDTKELEELRDDADRIDWMQAHMNYEFSTESDDGDLIFEVHKVTGYPNDREWHKVAEGRTLREVIDAAKAAS